MNSYLTVPASLAVGAVVLLSGPSAAFAAPAPQPAAAAAGDIPASPSPRPGHSATHAHTIYAVLPAPSRLRTTASAVSTSLVDAANRSFTL